jgi:hypothetical protein
MGSPELTTATARQRMNRMPRVISSAWGRAAIPNPKLWFAGSITAEATEYFAKNQVPSVYLRENVPQAALPRHFRQCNGMCLGSVDEGLVMVQAAACNLPLDCTSKTFDRAIELYERILQARGLT